MKPDIYINTTQVHAFMRCYSNLGNNITVPAYTPFPLSVFKFITVTCLMCDSIKDYGEFKFSTVNDGISMTFSAEPATISKIARVLSHNNIPHEYKVYGCIYFESYFNQPIQSTLSQLNYILALILGASDKEKTPQALEVIQYLKEYEQIKDNKDLLYELIDKQFEAYFPDGEAQLFQILSSSVNKQRKKEIIKKVNSLCEEIADWQTAINNARFDMQNLSRELHLLEYQEEISSSGKNVHESIIQLQPETINYSYDQHNEEFSAVYEFLRPITNYSMKEFVAVKPFLEKNSSPEIYDALCQIFEYKKYQYCVYFTIQYIPDIKEPKKNLEYSIYDRYVKNNKKMKVGVNPHLFFYNCAGGFKAQWEEAMNCGDLQLAVQSIILSMQAINWGDTIVIKRFLEHLNKNRDLCLLDTETGEYCSLQTIIERSKKHEEEKEEN